jgi:hypothetical protein
MATATETTIHNFMQDLKIVRDKTLKSMMQFQLEIAQGLQSNIQQNILNTFGGDRSDRSPLTRASMGGTAATQGRSGALYRSVQIEGSGDGLSVTVGGVGVPYAAAQEWGMHIYPKRSKYLTIPISSDFRGHRAREFDLIMGTDPQWGLVLMTRMGIAAYALRKHVEIKPRPYIQPAIDAMQTNEKVKVALMASFAPLQAEVIIE